MTRAIRWVFLALGFVTACGGSGSSDAPQTSVPQGGASGGVAGGAQSGSAGQNVAGSAGLGGTGTAGTSGAANAAGTAGGPASPAGGAGGDGAGGGDARAGENGADAGDPGLGAAGNGSEPLERVSTVPADKIDLLFVIDNSISMADKQEIFREAVPLLVERFVTPVCVDSEGEPTGQVANSVGQCAAGEPEFPPIRDIHIGVVTSSLGDSGGGTCADLDDDDKARLLPSMRDGLASWNDAGFLAWDPDQTRNDPPGESDPEVLVQTFQDLVLAAGEVGCGYEATLEAWYRFLIDPDPPSAVTRDMTTMFTVATYPDETILAQRAAFLRADSLVGIVMLTDENDCSIIDSGQGYIVGYQNTTGGRFQMPRATSQCAADPNDECCTSCRVASAPAGCPALADDVECQKGAYTFEEDSPNLRCFDQKRRFGFSLLQPIERYLNGLTAVEVQNRDGDLVPNPLFVAEPGKLSRDLSRIFLLGIVGVPWQDVADEASLDDERRLRYLSHDELVSEGRWDLLQGQDGELPGDPFLVETHVDRSTLDLEPHPLTGDEPASADETTLVNAINGHETKMTAADDLQYSCIFPLLEPRTCADDADSGCDCRPSDAGYNRAVCEGSQQVYAKAYPPGRHLELLRAFGDLTGNSVVASICPKVLESPSPTVDPDFGYNPAVMGLVDRMKSALAPTCLAEELEPDAENRVSCELLEVTVPTGACEPCTGPGRESASNASEQELLSRLSASRYCGQPGQPECDELCVCGLVQLEGDELAACQAELSVSTDIAGFCYVDAAQGIGNPALVNGCPVGRKRRLRLLGDGVPRSGATSFVLCGSP